MEYVKNTTFSNKYICEKKNCVFFAPERDEFINKKDKCRLVIKYIIFYRRESLK